MGFRENLIVTKRFLDKNFKGEKATFEHGYHVVIFDDMKMFFYPGDDCVRITTIPTKRKYNIKQSYRVVVGEGFCDLLLKYQPHKSNSELMVELVEPITEKMLNKIMNKMYNLTIPVFEQFEG